MKQNDFATQLQNYGTGNNTGCQHPINRIDDDNVCHLCGIDVMERKHITDFNPETMTLATQDDIRRIWHQLWGEETILWTLGKFNIEDGEYLDRTQEVYNGTKQESYLSNMPARRSDESLSNV